MKSGVRPKLILIRGFARQSKHWLDFPQQLEVIAEGVHVSTLDLPGFGEMADQVSPSSIRGIQQHVRARALQLGLLNEPVYLVAMSLGGMVALEWVSRNPQDVKKCVLINSSAANLSPSYQRLRWQIWPNMLRIVREVSPHQREKAILQLVANRHEAREAALGPWTQAALETPVQMTNVFRQLWAAARYKVPVKLAFQNGLVLGSLGDQLVEPSCFEALAQHLNWPLRTHPWAGHDLALDDPEWLRQELARFLFSS